MDASTYWDVLDDDRPLGSFYPKADTELPRGEVIL